jgi:hypothetical protein
MLVEQTNGNFLEKILGDIDDIFQEEKKDYFLNHIFIDEL